MTKHWRPFRDAREFARSLKLTGQRDWGRYCTRKLQATHGRRPDDIPSDPHRVYMDRGWAGFGDWLGTGNLCTHERNFLSFKAARRFARKLEIPTNDAWVEYAKTSARPDNIPADPRAVYAAEWAGWGDWLGTGAIANQQREFRSFRAARAFARRLQLPTQLEWRNYVTGRLEDTHGFLPGDIPAKPDVVYADDWANWGDWLGTK